ncbi:MAG TPA: tetratricopeptide repeat protein [Burkholderiales bacterium]|jgi:regulator of sirC expression with transglutaminase-like and TPR domain
MTIEAVEIDRWQRIAASSADASLAEGALLIAAEEYQDLDIDGYLQRIDSMGATLRRRLRSDISTTEALLALNRYVFEELGFSGNADDYYDPRNSYLNDVIDRKLGIPITLAVLYIEIGRRIGLPLHGVSFPNHFLVKCVLREGAIVLDPYARGASLALEDLQQRLQALINDVEVDQTVLNTMLAPARPTDIFARMLRNLRAIHLSKGDRLKALNASNRIINLVPGAADEYRDRAQLYFELECFRAALADFHTYLRLKPDAADSETVTRQIAELEPIAARLN